MTSPGGYPVLSRDKALSLGVQYNALLEASGKPHLVEEIPGAQQLVETRLGPEFNYDLFDILHTEFEARCIGLSNEDRQEIFVIFAAQLLDKFPHEILQDLDFWRYLSLFPLRTHIMRTKGDFMPSRYGGEGDGQIDKNWPLIEGLRWAWRLVFQADENNLRALGIAHKEAGYSGRVRDQYISNIVRPRWASFRPASQAFLKAALEPTPILDFDNNEQRYLNKFQQKVARTSHNILFEVLEEAELVVLFQALRPDAAK